MKITRSRIKARIRNQVADRTSSTGTSKWNLENWVIHTTGLAVLVVVAVQIVFSSARLQLHEVVIFQSILVFVPLSITATEVLFSVRGNAHSSNKDREALLFQTWRRLHFYMQLTVAALTVTVMFAEMPKVSLNEIGLTRSKGLISLLLFSIGSMALNLRWVVNASLSGNLVVVNASLNGNIEKEEAGQNDSRVVEKTSTD